MRYKFLFPNDNENFKCKIERKTIPVFIMVILPSHEEGEYKKNITQKYYVKNALKRNRRKKICMQNEYFKFFCKKLIKNFGSRE